jgi:hypothetical protein
MQRMPPSHRIGKKTEELLKPSLDGQADVTSLIVRVGLGRVVQEVVEQGVTDCLGRDHCERRWPEQQHSGCCSGHESGCDLPPKWWTPRRAKLVYNTTIGGRLCEN